MRLGFCFISQQPSIGFSNYFFLLETEIHTQILNTKPFLYDFMGMRYLQNKMRFLTQVIVINSNFSDFCPSGILIKMNINENVFIQFGQFMTYQGTLGDVSGIQGPFRGQSLSSGSLRGSQDHYRQT